MADKVTCGSFDILVPLGVAPSHSVFFPQKELKKLLQHFLTVREFFSVGVYKSYFANIYGSYDHISVVRAVCIFVHTDFTLMLACCPLL